MGVCSQNHVIEHADEIEVIMGDGTRYPAEVKGRDPKTDLALLEVGDTVLAMDLSHGGHLTHGHPLNQSGKQYEVVAYGVKKDTETIDYDKLRDQAKREKPRLLVGGAVLRIPEHLQIRRRESGARQIHHRGRGPDAGCLQLAAVLRARSAGGGTRGVRPEDRRELRQRGGRSGR